MKKYSMKSKISILGVLALVIVSFMILQLLTIYAAPYSKGDINGDGIVDYEDYHLLHRYLNGEITLNAQQLTAADINNDGAIGQDDRKPLYRLLTAQYNYGDCLGKSWTFNEEELGMLYEYDGLTIAPSSKSTDTQMQIKTANLYYEDEYYGRTLYFPGEGQYDQKAIVFYASKPSVLTLYSRGTGTSKVCVRSDSRQLASELLPNELSTVQVELPGAGKYYVYAQVGWIELAYMRVNEYMTGDLDANGKVEFDDLNILDDYLNDKIEFESWQMELADINEDEVTDEKDKKKLEENIRSNPANLVDRYSDKTWSFDGMYFNLESAISVKNENLDVEGLTLIAGDGAQIYKEGTKYYDGYFECSKYFITGGASDVKNGMVAKKGVRFKTDKPCYVTAFVRTASQNLSKIGVSRYGEVIGEENAMSVAELNTNGLQKVKFYLPQPDTYYIYGLGGSVKIYHISLREGDEGYTDADWNAENAGKTVNVVKDKEYEYLLTIDNVPDLNKGVYKIYFDQSMVYLRSLYTVNRNPDSENLYREIFYNDNDDGCDFTISEDSDYAKGYSGVVVKAKFKALKTGTATIRFGVERVDEW